MDNKDVPYIVFEGTVARFERTIRRLIILVGIVVLLLFVSNALWLYEWNQYDYGTVDIQNQDGGNANYIGANGYINNAEDSGTN